MAEGQERLGTRLAAWGKKYLAERFWPRALPEEYSEWTKQNPREAVPGGHCGASAQPGEGSYQKERL